MGLSKIELAQRLPHSPQLPPQARGIDQVILLWTKYNNCKNVVTELFIFTQESNSHGNKQSSSGNVQSNMAQKCGNESGAVCLTSKWNHNKYLHSVIF